MSKPVTEEGLQAFYNGIQPYLNGAAHAGLVPVGTIIAVMGNEAPTNYLVCDGSIYNINDYPTLAYYFEDQFESINYFGGNGITTFAVPDLRGEFLRGTGTNSHENQGNGADVGEHQDATELPALLCNLTSTINTYFSGETIYPKNIDNGISATSRAAFSRASSATDGLSGRHSTVSTRPTNTSVLYCIAVKNIYVDASDVFEPINDQDVQDIIDNDPPSARTQFTEYSLNEQIIGRWIDGKPIYQKTFFNITLSKAVWTNISSGFDNCVYLKSDIHFGTSYYATSSDYRQLLLKISGDYLQGYMATNYNDQKSFTFTIQYTKTTDTV